MMKEPESVPEVDVDTAHRGATEESAIIVDVRETEELQEVAIPGVIHIPLGELQQRVSEIPRESDVYIVCRSGRRSAMATEFLRQAGHDRVWNIRGGMIDWLRADLPAEWHSSR